MGFIELTINYLVSVMVLYPFQLLMGLVLYFVYIKAKRLNEVRQAREEELSVFIERKLEAIRIVHPVKKIDVVFA